MGRSSSATDDAAIRRALHHKVLRRWQSRDDAIVIDELGLAHAKCRIDVAVINGCIHGYEIKSARDTLDRLPAQIETYSRTLERLTLVCAPKHVRGAMSLTPKWCGIVEAAPGTRGAIHFRTLRRTTLNRDVDRRMMAHLLWRSEAISLLARYGHAPKELRKPREHLYSLIALQLAPKEITASIREFMGGRGDWRDRPAPAKCGD